MRLLIAVLVCSIQPIHGQIQLPAEEQVAITSPQYIQRTMNLLATSTPEKRNTVRILVYGQSLSAQDWWLEVEQYLRTSWPDANLIMENLSIGGFSSSILIRTVERDLLDFYPDLVIFHVFGSAEKYQEILEIMRSKTSTEVLIWNDPRNKVPPNEHHTRMSYQILPEFAARYQCAFVDLRTPIQELVERNGLVYADEFTNDGIHFNEKGCALIASQIIPILRHQPHYPADPNRLLTTHEVGKDLNWQGDELVLSFEGNRVDVVWVNQPDTGQRYRVLVDDQPPSMIPKIYNHSRPNDNGKIGWIWGVGAPVHIGRNSPWTNETFTLTYDSVDYVNRYFTFEVKGSESGFEGRGNNRQHFVSKSGRVVIEANEVNDSIAGDWHIFRTHDVRQFKIQKGYQTNWSTYLMGMDEFTPETNVDPTVENQTTLFKGLPNGRHALKIVADQAAGDDIKLIKVYRPMLD